MPSMKNGLKMEKNERTFVVEAYPTAARNAPVGCNAGTVEGPLLRLMRMPCLQLR